MNFVVSTFHPAHLLRNNRRFQGVVNHDLKRALDLTKGWRPKWSDEGNIYSPDAATVERVLGKMHGGEVAYDIETDGQHPLLCDIRCIGFFDGERSICIPFLYRDGSVERIAIEGKTKFTTRKVWKPFYKGKALVRVKAAMQKLWSAPGTKFDTQNGQYDRLCLESSNFWSRIEEGKPTPFKIPDASGDNLDTILAHHIVAGYLPHSLGFIATLYTEAPFYKATESGESWASESDAELWLYCLRDCRVTRIAALTLRAELKERKHGLDLQLYQHDAWQEAQAQQWRTNGVEVDLEALDYFRWHYAGVRDKALVKLKEVVEHRAMGDESKRSKSLTALLDRLSESDGEVLADDGTAKTSELFNPGSLIQLRMMMVDLGIPLTEKTATGELSTAKEFLNSARKELLESKVLPTDDRLAFLDYLFAWRESSKVYGTYLNPELIQAPYRTERGTWAVRIHPSFSVHVVPTGRLCIAGWTLVRTARGLVPLKSVQIGDLVWTHKQRWRPVRAVLHQGQQEVVDARLGNGHIVTATTGHRLLGADGQWVTLGELRECLQGVAEKKWEPRSSSFALPQLRLANRGAGGQEAWHHVPEYPGSTSIKVVPRSIQGTLSPPILSCQDGPQECVVGEKDGETSSLEGRVRGRVRLPDDSLAGEASVRPRRRDDEEARTHLTPKRDGGPPHQQQLERKWGRQPRDDHNRGAQSDPLPPVEGQPCCSVEEVVPRGSIETYDLTVEEDESFEAEGIFSHNSSSRPNFQNLPAIIRGMFVARPGHILVFGDWDALEMRLGAFLSGDPTFLEDLKAWDARTGPKVHVVNMCAIFNLKMEEGIADKYPGCYRAAKVFAYAVAYGAGSQTVFQQVRAEMPDMQWETFLECYDRYKKFRKVLFAFQAQVVLLGTQNQFLDTAVLKRRGWFWERSFGEDSPESSRMQNFPYQGTGADIVSLANRRVAGVVLNWQSKLKPNEVLQQLGQIHDELLFECPERLADEFMAEFKRVAELPCDEERKPWNLPVDVKKQKRWKKIQRKCGVVIPVKVKRGEKTATVLTLPVKCKEMVTIEPIGRNPTCITWEGTCKACGAVTKIEVPRTATLNEVA